MRQRKNRVVLRLVRISLLALVGLLFAGSQEARAAECEKCTEWKVKKNRVSANAAACPPGIGVGSNTGYLCELRWEKEWARCDPGDEMLTCKVKKDPNHPYPTTKFPANTCEKRTTNGAKCGPPGAAAGPALTGTRRYCDGKKKETGEPGDYLFDGFDNLVVIDAVDPGQVFELRSLTLRIDPSLFDFAAERGYVPDHGRARADVTVSSPFKDMLKVAGLPDNVEVVRGAAAVVELAQSGSEVTIGLDIDMDRRGKGVVLEISNLVLQAGKHSGFDDMVEDDPDNPSEGEKLCQTESAEAWLSPRVNLGEFESRQPSIIVADVNDECSLPQNEPADQGALENSADR